MPGPTPTVTGSFYVNNGQVCADTLYGPNTPLKQGVNSQSVAGGAGVVLTAAQYQNPIQVFTGVLTANIVVTLAPAAISTGAKWFVQNNTTGAYTLTVQCDTGTGVVITQTKGRWVWFNGTNLAGMTAEV